MSSPHQPRNTSEGQGPGRSPEANGRSGQPADSGAPSGHSAYGTGRLPYGSDQYPYGSEPQPPYGSPAYGGEPYAYGSSQPPYGSDPYVYRTDQSAYSGRPTTAPATASQRRQLAAADVGASSRKVSSKPAVFAGIGTTAGILAAIGLFLPYFAKGGASLSWASAGDHGGSSAPFLSSLAALTLGALVSLLPHFGKRARRVRGSLAGLALTAAGGTVLANWIVNFSPGGLGADVSRGVGFWVIGAAAILVTLAGAATLLFTATSPTAGRSSDPTAAPYGEAPAQESPERFAQPASQRTESQPSAPSTSSAGTARSGAVQWPPPRT